MGKKANGEGSITKRSDGRYMGRFTVNNERKAIYGKTHEEVRVKMLEILNDINKGTYVDPNGITLGEWLIEWLASYVMGVVKQSTYISYYNYVHTHIIPEIGQMKLQGITKDTLQKFFKAKGLSGRKDGKAGGLSPKTLRNMYNMLHSALDEAIPTKINRNPILGVKLPKIEVKEMRVLTLSEQEAVTNAVRASEELHAFGIIFALSTGLRIGELLALKWIDVDFTKHTIKIRRTINRLAKIEPVEENANKTEIVIASPKTHNAVREVPIFPELWKDLISYREKQQEQSLYMGEAYEDQGFIFCNPLGKYFEQRTYADTMMRFIKVAGIANASFHALRHTFATRALESGMDIKVLSSILGHAQPSTTLNKYGHALPDHKKASMEKMRSIYLGESVPERADSNPLVSK